MSDLRKGCCGGFFGCGLMSAASNHGLLTPSLAGNPALLIFGGLVGFFFAVMMFGERQP